MLLINLWDQLNDEQRACVDEIVQRNTRLNEAVQKYATAEAAALKDLDDTRAAHQRERDDWRADFSRLTKEAQGYADALLAARNRVSHITNTVAPVLADWLTTLAAFKDESLSDEYCEMRRAVVQLVRELGMEVI